MNDYGVSTWDALLVFVDIVDSSILSSISGVKKYARKVMSFQKLFGVLGHQYFWDKPSFDEKVSAWCEVKARGDEGLVFVIDREQSGTELINKAIRFAFDLKMRMKIVHGMLEDRPPQEMKIAVGIHYGEVAAINSLTMTEDGPRNLIQKILGYQINYAKRVESSSRVGKFSKVFLSRDAADLVCYQPIALHKHEVPLKGIQANEEVYEIRSVLLDNVPIKVGGGEGIIDEEEFIRYFTSEVEEEDFLRDSWLKSAIVSVLDGRKDAAKGTDSERGYVERIQEIAWGKLVEDDPMLLYWRARVCENEEKYTRAISYLKEIIKACPSLIRARTQVIENCYKMMKQKKKVTTDIIFIRDTAEELLELEEHDGMLSKKERERLIQILDEVKPK